jgi:hypothetical protein
VYGIFKTHLISKRNKQYGFLVLFNLFACVLYVGNHFANDVKIPFPESEPDYYGYGIFEIKPNTSGADLQSQLDDYKREHGESTEHKQWNERKTSWEVKQFTSPSLLFYIYLVISFGLIFRSYRKKPSAQQVLVICMLLLSTTGSAQTKAEKEFIDKNPAPLSEAYGLYALVNHWKEYKDEWGYTVSFPKTVTDGGTTASGIHYYNALDVNDIAVEADCVDKPANLKQELEKWYNSTVKDINPAVYNVVSKELTDNSFLIVWKNKDGSGTNYDKCIVGSRCLFKLSFTVDYHNLQKLNEKDANVILHLFKASTK